MDSAEVAAFPKPPALQDPPSDGFYDETQWAVFMALMDTAIPSLVSHSALTDKFNQISMPDGRYQSTLKKIQDTMVDAPDSESFQAFLKDKPSDLPAFRQHAVRTLSRVSEKMRSELGGVLSLLSTKAGAFVLTGHCVPFHKQPAYIRESILQGWRASWFTKLRVLAKSVWTLAQLGWIQTAPIFRQVSGYPDVPVGWKAGPHFEYSFLQFPGAPSPEPAELETDIVVVGSGCGGAVCAKVLAEAGHRVLVVDKGYYFPPTALPMPQEAGARYLYENGGFVNSADSSIAAVAGSTWGGGGTVNWSVSLQTQGYVRREWAEDKGLAFFATQAFQDSLDRVCGFMGVRDDNVRQSHRGQVVLDGAKRLGWHAKPLPQNSGGSEHYCGHCHLGCGSADKQGPAVSWLPAAARAGAEFLEGFQVDKVLFDKSKKANGVVGTWTSRDSNGSVSGSLQQRTQRKVTMKAKKVIVACGSLWSPMVLLKSGLKNRHIGRNLHLHPCNFAGGFYKEDIRPWEGGIITSYSSSFENLDGHGHGTKLEATCMVPYAVLANFPASSGLDFKLSAMRYRHLNAFISLTRDRDSGSVRLDPKGKGPILDYTPSAFDRAHTLEGVIGLCKLLYITGAVEIRAFLPGVEPFIRKDASTPASDIKGDATRSDKAMEEVDMGISDPAFVAWLDHVRAVGNAPPTAVYISAHQMGSCRMSSHQGDGVVDAKGHVWGTKDLYVADASVFPSASGVNPMVTVMAIADWIARGIVRDLNE